MSTASLRRPPARALLAGGIALVATSLATGTAALGPAPATASSHREAPLISGQPEYDNTDVYAFTSPDKPDTTTLIANWWPFAEPAGGPNFYKFPTDARYDIHIDNTGDGRSELIYRWTFEESYRSKDTFLYNTGPVTSLDDPDLNYRQTYDLQLLQFKDGKQTGTQTLADDAPIAPSNVGKASMPRYGDLRKQAVRAVGGSGTSYVGQADDPFFLDLRVFDLLYGGDLSEVGRDTLKGYNVNTVALQVPTKELTAGPGKPVIGVWSTTERRTAANGWQQVSRLGMPLVNELVIPVRDKDTFNASTPWQDGRFAKYVNDPEVARLLEKIYKLKAPAVPRKDLVQVFLTGVPGLNQPDGVRPHEAIRLNTSIKPAADPKRLGVLDGDRAGYPNGRRLTDDTVDISLQVVRGELAGQKNDLGDAVDANDKKFDGRFPYVAEPTSGSRGPLAGGGSAASASSASPSVSSPSVSSPSAGPSVKNRAASPLTGGRPSAALPGASGTGEGDGRLVLISAASGAAALAVAGLGLLRWRRTRRRSTDRP
ncbi:DUF4331 domain-containing protein [Streptomyces sp. MST-110588]|uniref:DUF4331 domain-containing protein n=1 Tax=Streptomyces sp. MST-110588 TaxID=2833628 RepID=UPI001F5CB5C8|nr:DUF4331 domain-containing protein [Streptomyces sp. MST-110588]UNO43413.1 DUF4331 domain-containing protein [Streptomyces sp. MST-110588]